MKRTFFLTVTIFIMVFLMTGCGQEEVIVYTSVDENFSSVIFEKFEKDTGIKVLAKYDIEAAKTSGLVQALITEKKNPRADVFWNGEIAQTLVLKENDVLESYISKISEDIPENFKDADGYWTAFGGRARVFIVNTDLVSKTDYPKTILDFLNEKYSADNVGMARPLSGTTFTQAGALYSLWGSEKAKKFYSDIADRGVRIVEGNSIVRDLVAEGSLMWGLTDTDDALGAMKKGAPVDIIFPDLGDEDIGTLVIPNSIALIKGGKNNKNAKEFIDYMLDIETEKYLIELDWCQVGIRETGADTLLDISGLKSMKVSFESIFKNINEAKQDLQELFIN
jgi:iron(III) transport system substrate-binding protein